MGDATNLWSCRKPVPSLFTFNIKDSRIKELPGVAQVTVKVKDTKLVDGPLLMHWE
jgi:hypothetical protein